MGQLSFTFDFLLNETINVADEVLGPITVVDPRGDVRIGPPGRPGENAAQRISICLGRDCEEQSVQEVMKQLGLVAGEYLERTLDLIRVHTRQFHLGLPVLSGIKNRVVTVRREDGSKLKEGQNVTVYVAKTDPAVFPLDRSIWARVGRDLKSGTLPRSHLFLLLDAKYHGFVGRNRESIVLLTSAIEYFSLVTLGRDKHEEGQACRCVEDMSYADYFVAVIEQQLGKAVRRSRSDDFHRLLYLFSARNMLAHGGQPRFRIGATEHGQVQRAIGPCEVTSENWVLVDGIMCCRLADRVFELLEWIDA